jgi:AcrR family transcriptional regulator
VTTRVAGVTTPPSSGTRRRNRRGEGALLRDDIVTAAASILDEAGTEEAVTLRAVARRAGVTAPSIDSHFADRQGILLAVVGEAFSDLTHHLREAVSQAAEADPATRLVAVCDAYLDFGSRQPQRYRVMFGGVWNAEEAMANASVSAADVTALGQETLGLLSECLRDCSAAGASASTDPDADAVALWLGLHGLAQQRNASPACPWPADIQRRIVTHLARLVHSDE